MKLTISNVAQSPADDRDYPFIPAIEQLPARVDLRKWIADMEDQGGAGSCTAQATTAGGQYFLYKSGRNIDPSPRFTYYVTRDYEGRLGQDGAVLRNAMKCGQKIGMCPEELCPYDERLIDEKPQQTAFDAAKEYQIERYERIELNQDDWMGTIRRIKQALAEGLPVVFAMKLGRRWTELKGPLSTHNYVNFTSTMPGTEYIGNHAMVLVGYDIALDAFICLNSWGGEWGDNGYGRLPYVLVSDMFEAWVIRKFAGFEIAAPRPAPTPDPIPQPEPAPVPDPVIPPEPPKPEPQPEPVPPAPQVVERSDNSLAIIGILVVIALISKAAGFW